MLVRPGKDEEAFGQPFRRPLVRDHVCPKQSPQMQQGQPDIVFQRFHAAGPCRLLFRRDLVHKPDNLIV